VTRDELRKAHRERWLNVVQKSQRAIAANVALEQAETWDRNAKSQQSALAVEKAKNAAKVEEVSLIAAVDELEDFLVDTFPAARSRKSKP
jgi:hypothetical protein